MPIAQKKGRDQGGKIPTNRQKELVSAAMDINDIYEVLNLIQQNADPMRTKRLNQSDIMILAERINSLVFEAKRDIFSCLFKMKSAGVDIEPVAPE